MTDNPWLSQPDAHPFGYADPLAQRRIDQLESAIGDLYQARDEAEMERDRLTAKLARVEALADDAAVQDRSEVAPVYGVALLIRQALADPEESDV